MRAEALTDVVGNVSARNWGGADAEAGTEARVEAVEASKSTSSSELSDPVPDDSMSEARCGRAKLTSAT